MVADVELFLTKESPFASRIVWALKLKGIQYTAIEENLFNKSPLLRQYNPLHRKVPVLVHKGKPISESLVILEYIEENWKQNPLLPEDPNQRATARLLAKYIDEEVLPLVLGTFMKQAGKEQEEYRILALKKLKYLEEELNKGKKTFFGGYSIGLVDIALGSWLASSFIIAMETMAGLKLIDEAEEKKFPLFCRWKKIFSNLPLIKENMADPINVVLPWLMVYRDVVYPMLIKLHRVKDGRSRL